MLRRFSLLVVVVLFFMPALASAGLISIYVATGGDASGTITPKTGGSKTGGYAVSAKTFTLTPAKNYTLDRVTNNSVTVPGAKISGPVAGSWSYTVPLSSVSQTVFVYFKSSVPAQPPVLIASAPTSITTALNTPMTISGATSTILYLQPGTKAKFKWTSASSAAVFSPISSSVRSPGYISTSFTAAQAGSYSATLTLTAPGAESSTANVAITVQGPGVGASNFCISCHQSEGRVYGGSRHAATAQGPTCDKCHNPGLILQHPGLALSTMGNVCVQCHGSDPAKHPFAIGSSTCVSCHDPHTAIATSGAAGAPHYNNITTADPPYPASYMTSKATCLDCHFEDALNKTVRTQWAKSGHANIHSPAWTTYDFKTKAGCVQCHTTTGFIAYSTGKVTTAWGVASDKTKELLTCDGCHSDFTKGIVALVDPIRPYADTPDYINKEVGISNICMDCHSGRNTGRSIQSTDFTHQAFISPHYKSSGGVFYAKEGYHFPGQTYGFYSTNTHRNIGMANTHNTGTAGPCVGCHMTQTQSHLFKTISTASNGSIALIRSTMCANCHGTTLTDTTKINAHKDSFNATLLTLNSALAYKGFVYSLDNTFTDTTNWGADQIGANMMGGAFNYTLLRYEQAAYIHNEDYAKKLLFDSIDAVYNGGTITGNLNATLLAMVDNNLITSTTAAKVADYKSTKHCISCHPTLSGAHAVHVGDLVPLIETYGDGGNYSTTTMYRYGCANCHPTDPAMHMNGIVDVTIQPDAAAGTLRIRNYNVTADGLYPGSGITGTKGSSIVCANVYCHSNGYTGNPVYATTPDWYGGKFTGDKCANCHGNSPNTRSAFSNVTTYGSPAHTIHVVGIHALNILNGNSGNLPAGSSGSVGHGIASQATTLNCNICHADTVTFSRNDNNTICASCHQGQGNLAVIANKANHVNGSINVAFANISVVSKAQLESASFAAYSANYWSRNGGNYKNGAGAYDVSKVTLRNGASYDGTGGCSNVACHMGQAVNWSNTNSPSYCALCHTSL